MSDLFVFNKLFLIVNVISSYDDIVDELSKVKLIALIVSFDLSEISLAVLPFNNKFLFKLKIISSIVVIIDVVIFTSVSGSKVINLIEPACILPNEDVWKENLGLFILLSPLSTLVSIESKPFNIISPDIFISLDNKYSSSTSPVLIPKWESFSNGRIDILALLFNTL